MSKWEYHIEEAPPAIQVYYEENVYQVIQAYFLTRDDKKGIITFETYRGYGVIHVPSGRRVVQSMSNRKSAIGFCQWLAKWLPDYDPNNPEHQAKWQAMKKDVHGVFVSFGGLR